jgi:hypothetical protein
LPPMDRFAHGPRRMRFRAGAAMTEIAAPIRDDGDEW